MAQSQEQVRRSDEVRRGDRARARRGGDVATGSRDEDVARAKVAASRPFRRTRRR